MAKEKTTSSQQLKIGRFSCAVAEFLVRFRWILLAVAVVVAAFSFAWSQKLDFNRSVESMFSPNDPVLPPYERLKQKFGGNEIILAVYEDEGLFHENGDGIRRLSKVSKELLAVEGVKGVLSLAELNRALNKLHVLSRMNLLQMRRQFDSLFSDAQDEDAVIEKVRIVAADDPMASDFRELFEGYTHSKDGKTVAIACILQPKEECNLSRTEIIADLREIINQQNLGQLTGEPVMVVDGFGYVERDGRRLGLNCVILLSLVIIVCFRSIRWVLIPLAVMQLTLWMTRAVLVVSGFQLSMVSSMLTAIVTVIAVATTMHVILRYREARTDGLDQISAMKRAMAILFWPIFWACVTDATGFASLLIAEVGPVQDFGAMMAIASLLVLVSILLLVVPLELLGKFDADPKKAWGEGRMGIALQNSTKVIGRYPVLLAMVTTLGAVFVSAGNFFLEVETDFTKNFRKGTPIAVSYNFVEKRLGGAGVIDVILPAPKQLDNRYLKRVHQFEEEIRNLEFKSKNGERERALSKVISLADVLAATENAKGIGWLPLALRLQGMERLMPSLFASLYTKTPDKNGDYFYRVMLRASQRPSAKQKQWLVDEIQSAAERSFPVEENHQGPETTGFYILLSRLVQSILRDQYWSFALAIIGIALVMTISFRSIPLAAIAMVPNLLPILVVMGTLGWLGIKLNMGAAMIAAVSLGLSIDSSIHYLWSFQRWRASGLSVAESIVETQLQVGRAVIFSTLALVLGFSTLCLSEFVPTIYFGALVSATMLGGLFGNLVVLPVLLNLIYRKRKTTDAIND